MVQLVLLAAKFLFVLVLYLFVYMVIRTIAKDMRSMSFPVGGAMEVVLSDGGIVSVEGTHAAWALTVVESPSLPIGRSLNLPAGSRIVIGRLPESDVQLLDTFVSGRHASVESTPEGLVLEDLGSTNGTTVNKQALDRPILLAAGDVVGVGDTMLRVEAR